MDIQPEKNCEHLKCPKTLKTKIRCDPDAKAKCQICGQILKTSRILRTHMARMHTNRERPRCPTCHRVFFDSANLRGHIKAVHSTSERPRIPCTFPHCEKSYLRKNDLARHVQIEHSQIPIRFRCALCEKEFKTRAKLERHILTHTTEKPCKCTTCGKSFACMTAIKVHEMSHLEKSARPRLQCRICPQTFLSSRGLQHHIRVVHENQRNYLCRFCDKKFSTSQNLRGHVEARHLTDKVWIHSCDKCEYKSHSKVYLGQHLRRHNATKRHECYFCKKQFVMFPELVIHCSRVHCLEK
ncbi:zinc finger protein 525-like [Folsomia candida]|uniref:zinc finger protein 525-like n=1 Tax=Folsomia candida TaxID=158441 RepID=UPI001604B852|nr:zinc finger protein 525-like [Folsomia candida]